MFCLFIAVIMKRDSKKKIVYASVFMWVCVCVCVYIEVTIRSKMQLQGTVPSDILRLPSHPPFVTHTQTHTPTGVWLDSTGHQQCVAGPRPDWHCARTHAQTHTHNQHMSLLWQMRSEMFLFQQTSRTELRLPLCDTATYTQPNTALTRLHLPYKTINKYFVWILQCNFKIIANRMETVKSL